MTASAQPFQRAVERRLPSWSASHVGQSLLAAALGWRACDCVPARSV